MNSFPAIRHLLLVALALAGASVGPGPNSIPGKPVTTARTGSHATYNVGPGQTYLEPDTVPWGALQAGDVVNIYQRATPYRWKIGIRGQGTQAAPIVVNGVTDAAGNRPVFDFNGARTASGSNPGGNNNVFNPASPEYGESLGGIVVKRGPDDDYGSYSPRWIEVRNLELHGATNGNSYTTLAGGTATYSGSAGVWLQLGDDILLENLVIYDNAFGIFTMAKDGLLSETCRRVTVRGCRVYGNGVVGSYYEHNFYVQCHLPVIEGNYIGRVRAGSEGSSYKSRSSGEIFRYNYVEGSSRAIDWVYSEEQDTDGIVTQPEYGTDFAYGNVIVNDTQASSFASSPIHYGGDNLGRAGSRRPRAGPRGRVPLAPLFLEQYRRPPRQAGVAAVATERVRPFPGRHDGRGLEQHRRGRCRRCHAARHQLGGGLRTLESARQQSGLWCSGQRGCVRGEHGALQRPTTRHPAHDQPAVRQSGRE
ncbi:MAG: right-handed parallel beta-helix repeat-containing protein [Opitutaceae bacterium]|nr:right-handed parallel beta-helix repeat-containing protein [Opitutaceae bacterium]